MSSESFLERGRIGELIYLVRILNGKVLREFVVFAMSPKAALSCLPQEYVDLYHSVSPEFRSIEHPSKVPGRFLVLQSMLIDWGGTLENS